MFTSLTTRRRDNGNMIKSNLLDTWDKDLTELVNSFFGESNLSKLVNKSKKSSDYPKVDIYQDKANYCIDVSVPGVKKEDLKVEAFDEDGEKYVRVSGKMSEDHENKDAGHYYVRELRKSSFSRVLGVPAETTGDPTTKLADGVLSLRWELKQVLEENKQTKTIEIQ